jgi:hypothetical protein
MISGAGAAGRAVTSRVPVSAGRKGFKAELDGLRERMRGLGFGFDEIATEVSRRYRVRPREAYRLAWGWSLGHAAARFNDHAARQGNDSQARAGMTGPHLCEYEKWPHSTRKPSVYVLCLLAGIYQADVRCLLDLADHENLPQRDRLVLLSRPDAETPSGELEPDGEQEPQEDPGGQAGDARAAAGEGMSLSLPYVPGRLVIEVSGPAGNASLLAGGGGGREIMAGRLALVPDRSSGTEVAGA